ncbi:MAG: response regulator [Candidatus Bathyarchaeota archaeon]|nr:response regulator [Candidatus Bathyarchaeota archaeon]
MIKLQWFPLSEFPLENTIKILHVDDEDDQLEFLKKFLIEIDATFTIESTNSPAQVLDWLSKKYDCIVSDYQMPAIDGISLAKRVRQRSKIPFIIYTGRGSEEVAEDAFEAGVDDYIRKEMTPGHYHVLAKSIRQVVEKHRSEELYRAIAESSRDALIITRGGKVLFANQAMAEILETSSPEQIYGLNPIDWVSDSERRRVEKAIAERPNGRRGPKLVEFKMKKEVGDEIYLEASISQLNHLGKPATLIFYRDITERINSEKALIQAKGITEETLTSERDVRSKLTILHSYASKIVEAKTLETVYDLTLDAIVEALDFQWAGIGDVSAASVKFAHTRGNSLPSGVYQPLEVMDTINTAIKMGEAQIVPDPNIDHASKRQRDDPFLSEIAVPVMFDGYATQVIAVKSRLPDAFSVQDRRFLEILGFFFSSYMKIVRKKHIPRR